MASNALVLIFATIRKSVGLKGLTDVTLAQSDRRGYSSSYQLPCPLLRVVMCSFVAH